MWVNLKIFQQGGSACLQLTKGKKHHMTNLTYHIKHMGPFCQEDSWIWGTLRSILYTHTSNRQGVIYTGPNRNITYGWCTKLCQMVESPSKVATTSSCETKISARERGCMCGKIYANVQFLNSRCESLAVLRVWVIAGVVDLSLCPHSHHNPIMLTCS